MGMFPTRELGSFDFREVGYEKKEWFARIMFDQPHKAVCYS